MQAKPSPRRASALALLATGLAGGLSLPATAGTILEVPGALNLTIQEAIDIAESLGATQLNIADGVYVESLRLPDNGYDLVLMGNPADRTAVVINPLGLNDSAIHVLGGQTAATRLISLTIAQGNADGVDDGDPQADERGGGLYVNGSSVTVSDCWFVSNMASGAGGGFYVNAGTVTFDNCLFQGNQASNGGGAYLNNATVTFTDCTFQQNLAFPNLGGGMRTFGSTTTLTRCRFVGNSANLDGGGIWQSGGILTIIASELVGNDATLGGGVYAAGTVVVRDTIINGNIAANTGSGIYAQGGSSLTLVNASVVHNAGGNVIFGGGSKTIRNSIVWSNAGGTIGGGANSVSYSMVEGNWAGVGNIDPPGGPDFEDADGADDILGNLDDDLHLAATSPAIDAGDASVVIGQYPVDRGGLPRAVDDPDTDDTGLVVLGIAVDMGAHELQPAPVTPSCPTDINGDGVTNVLDLIDVLLAFGAACP